MQLRVLAAALMGATLVVAQAPAPAPTATPLPLPANPAATCTAAAMFEVMSSVKECTDTLLHREESVLCCTALAEAYGPNSTAPTANCFCAPEYWTELMELSKVNYANWAGYLDLCSKLGLPIPYYQDGKGPCSGVEAEAEAASAEASAPTVLPMRTFGGWLAGLGSDPWDAASFTFAILSAIGGCVMAWSFLFDAYVDLRSYVRPVSKAA